MYSEYSAALSASADICDDDEYLDFETFMGQDTQPSTDENDIRLVDPVNWDEAFALQRALIPSLNEVMAFTGLTIPMTSSWRCYKTQLGYFQAALKELCDTTCLPVETPKITSLENWEGGINNVDAAISDVLQERRAKEILNYAQPILRSIQNAIRLQNIDSIENPMVVLNEWLKKIHDAGQPKRNNLMEVLDYAVTQDPEGYLAWLSTEGEASYLKHEDQSIPWEQWCYSVAPARYEFGHPQEDVGLRIVNEVPHFKFETRNASKGCYRKYGASRDHPKITLKEAQQGRQAWKAAAGMAISQEAKACFWAINGRGCMKTLF